MDPKQLQQAIDICKSGGVIAYPTESVFGLGCLPDNRQAVYRILELKQRSVEKGLICVAANTSQLEQLVDFSSIPDLERVTNSWPGPYTWLIPSYETTPEWLTGEHNTLAVRVSAHPVVQKICQEVGPLVSTSANQQGMLPAYTALEVERYFGGQLDYIFPAELPRTNQPTQICDAITGKIVRIS